MTSLSAGPCPQALAADSSVAKYSVTERRVLQSSTKYCVVLYLAYASDGGRRKRVSRPLQYSSTPGVAIYPARKTVLS